MPKLVGMNHIALEVGDLDEALAFWKSIFGELELRGRIRGMAFIDMGDQFINMTLMPHPEAQEVERRHIGLVVDDRSRILELAKAAGAPCLSSMSSNVRPLGSNPNTQNPITPSRYHTAK